MADKMSLHHDKINASLFKLEIFSRPRDGDLDWKPSVCSALPSGFELKFRFWVSRKTGNYDFSVNLFSESESSRVVCSWITLKNGFDIYESTIHPPEIGLYFLCCSFRTSDGKAAFVFPDGSERLPITVYFSDFTTPKWLKGGIIYQIFTDRFAKSENHSVSVKPGAILNPDWENGVPEFAEKPGDPLKNNVFFGGSLYGIIEKLDYLQSLGVSTLYLNPIFEAASNHKYDTGDYFSVDRMFGGEAALDKLISALKKRGMRLILDGVFNHTGDDSVYFNKYGRYTGLGAYQGKASKYYEWYDFICFPDNYSCWWGVKILPAINKQSESFRNFICGEKGVIRHYLKKGVDGWRLDVADELSDEFLNALRKAAKTEKKDSVIIGEVWEDASVKIAYGLRRRYFQGSQLDSVMNYPLRNAIIDYLISGDADKLSETAISLYLHYPKCVSDVQMNLLGTHDTERILNLLAQDGCTGMTNRQLSVHKMDPEARLRGRELLRLAAVLLYTLPGVPCIYYGDEVGMEGGRDPFNRKPFPWGHEDQGMLDWFRKLGKLRADLSELAEGKFSILHSDDSLIAYRRGDLICAVNRGDTKVIVTSGPLQELLSGNASIPGEDGMYRMSLGRDRAGIYKPVPIKT